MNKATRKLVNRLTINVQCVMTCRVKNTCSAHKDKQFFFFFFFAFRITPNMGSW